MTIALRGAGQTGTGTAGTCSVSLSAITGLAQGDVVVLFAGITSTSAAGDPAASGWTDCGVGKRANSANTAAMRCFYKVMGSTPDTSVSITGGASGDGCCAAAFAFSGVNNDTPLTATSVSVTGSSTNPDPAAITPSMGNACIVAGAYTPIQDTTPSATVTNYLPSTPLNTNSAATRAGTVAAMYRIKTGGTGGVSENPGAFTSWTTSAWASITVALNASQALSAKFAPAALFGADTVNFAMLEAWWDFISGANDATGNGNNGTLHGTSLTTGPGLPARSFNGTTDYIDGTSLPLEP
jgi:hypothetical protein